MKNYILSLLLMISFTQNNYSQENQKVLDTITIKGQKKTFTTKNGNLKVDISNSIYRTISNPIDLLAKLPNIQISPDKETVTVIGKGIPILYLDNQKISSNDLNSLSVEDIKSIEIIKNPSSKYEAEGRVVIQITKKNNKKEGFKAVISENSSCQKYFNNYFGINSSVKKNKFEYKVNLNYNQITVWESNSNDFSIPSNSILSNYLAKAITKRPQFIYGCGLFYKISEDDYCSANLSQRIQKDIFDITTDTYNQQQNTINFIKTLNSNIETRKLTNSFINYNHKIKSIEGFLFTGFQYSNFRQKIESVIFNDYNENGFECSQKRNQQIGISVFSARSDFEKEFRNKIKLESGILYLQANSNTNFLIENQITSSYTQYNYKEKNIACYSQLSGNIKKVTISFGLRAENTIVKGKYTSENDSLVDKNYINLFPKTSIEIPIDSSKTITFNYAKSISRPNYSTTSQVSAYINPYFVWSNNINLDPSITDEVSINYEYKDKSIRLSYNKISHPVYNSTTYNETQNLLMFQTANFNQERGFNLEFTIPFKYKFWNTTNTISGIINKIENQQSIINQTKPYLYWYSNHTFKLPKEIEMSLTGWGITHRSEGVFERNALFTIDYAISKTFFKTFFCTISYNNIFRSIKYKENFTINRVSANGIYYTDTNLVSFSVKYTIGKIKNSEYKEKNIDENSNRIR